MNLNKTKLKAITAGNLKAVSFGFSRFEFFKTGLQISAQTPKSISAKRFYDNRERQVIVCRIN